MGDKRISGAAKKVRGSITEALGNSPEIRPSKTEEQLKSGKLKKN
jgi:hypothetical protein